MDPSERIAELERRLAALEQLLAEDAPFHRHEIALTDAAGAPRLVMHGGGTRGYPELRLHDAAGQNRIRLAISGDTPLVELKDRKGRTRLWIGIGADSNPLLQLRDWSGRDRLSVFVLSKGGARLSFVNEGGTVRSIVSQEVMMAEEGLFKTLFTKADAEEERRARPQLTVLQGGMSDDEEDDEPRP